MPDAHTWTTTPACSKRAKEGEQRATALSITTPPTLPIFGHPTADAGRGAGDPQLSLLALILLISISARQRLERQRLERQRLERWSRAPPAFCVCSRREG